MRLIALVLIAALISGCATTKSQPAPPVAERQPPRYCLAEPRLKQPCTLPEWWDRATPEDKAALELNCKNVDVAMIRERDAMLADCRAWHGVK
jgi:hypothetical protein